MKVFLTLLLFLLTGFLTESLAASSPASAIPEKKLDGPLSVSVLTSYKAALSLTPREYEKITGRKLRLKEKIALNLVKWKLAKRLRQDDEITPRQQKQGRLSLIFGAVSLVTVFLPVVSFLAIGFAIAGLVLGIKSLRGNGNTQGILGVVFSSLVLVIFLLAIIFVAAYFASF